MSKKNKKKNTVRVELKKDVILKPVTGQDGRFKLGRKMYWVPETCTDENGKIVAAYVKKCTNYSRGCRTEWSWPLPVEFFDLENSTAWKDANAAMEDANAAQEAKIAARREKAAACSFFSAAALNDTFSGDEVYTIPCTGDAVKGDHVRFSRALFSGSFRNAKFVGFETITGEIIADSYGKDKQQHTFTLLLENGEKLRIKGRNLYANGVYRKAWEDESARAEAADEKHARGDTARAAREERRSCCIPY